MSLQVNDQTVAQDSDNSHLFAAPTAPQQEVGPCALGAEEPGSLQQGCESVSHRRGSHHLLQPAPQLLHSGGPCRPLSTAPWSHSSCSCSHVWLVGLTAAVRRCSHWHSVVRFSLLIRWSGCTALGRGLVGGVCAASSMCGGAEAWLLRM